MGKRLNFFIENAAARRPRRLEVDITILIHPIIINSLHKAPSQPGNFNN